MSPYTGLLEQLGEPPALRNWMAELVGCLDVAVDPARHGDLAKWQAAVAELATVGPGQVDFASAAVRIDHPESWPAERQAWLTECLQRLHPWRKGPFDLHGVYIDAEWRSDWKWQRVLRGITPLTDRRVLDVGCGNGYYGWRMLGAGARDVVGLDPTLLYVMQFQAVKALAGAWPLYVLPFGCEVLPAQLGVFDTVFSMGVLYHRRAPQEHLVQLREALRPGGELVLETLVIDGAPGAVLTPGGRYAQMGNVWCIPSVTTVEDWLRQSGYRNLRVVDVRRTTPAEQRSTPWMCFQSLADGLDPHHPERTVEGWPAPQRAIVVADAVA